MSRILSLLVLLILPMSLPAEQGDLPIRTSGFYVGAALGSADAEIKTDLGSVSGSDTAWRFTAGYRWWNTFMPWDIDLGLEFSYIELGDRQSRLSDGSDWQLENSGIAGAVTGYWPVSQHIDITGKGGLIYSDTELSNQTVAIPSGTDSSTDILLGLGVAWRMTGPWSAALEYEYFDTLDGASLASIVVYYQFK